MCITSLELKLFQNAPINSSFHRWLQIYRVWITDSFVLLIKLLFIILIRCESGKAYINSVIGVLDMSWLCSFLVTDEGKKFWKSWKGMSTLAIGLSITIMVNKIPAYFKTCYFHSVHIVLTRPGRWLSVKKEKKPNNSSVHILEYLPVANSLNRQAL